MMHLIMTCMPQTNIQPHCTGLVFIRVKGESIIFVCCILMLFHDSPTNYSIVPNILTLINFTVSYNVFIRSKVKCVCKE